MFRLYSLLDDYYVLRDQQVSEGDLANHMQRFDLAWNQNYPVFCVSLLTCCSKCIRAFSNSSKAKWNSLNSGIYIPTSVFTVLWILSAEPLYTSVGLKWLTDYLALANLMLFSNNLSSLQDAELLFVSEEYPQFSLASERNLYCLAGNCEYNSTDTDVM